MQNTSTYPYRVERFNKMEKSWNLEKLHDLMLVYKPDEKEITEFKNNIMLYIAKAFYFDSTLDENIFLDRLEEKIDLKDNITPNGAVVPKKEYQLEYNLVLRSWSKMIEKIIAPNPSLLYKNRITPNIRIKFGQDPIENKDRGLNTAFPHSDAWVESSYGINCFIPIIGDIKNNSMDYYVPINPDEFKDEFLATAKSYKDMQWVLDYYKMDKNLRPEKGNVYFSDFALIHNTSRNENCRARVSIDTAIYVEEHEPHAERMAEYISDLKIFGESIFIATKRSIHEENIFNKQSHFSHYTTGTLKVINCEVE